MRSISKAFMSLSTALLGSYLVVAVALAGELNGENPPVPDQPLPPHPPEEGRLAAPTCLRMGCTYPCDPYAGHTLTPNQFSTIIINHQAWIKAGKPQGDKRRANLCGAKLPKLGLGGFDFQEAILDEADLQNLRLIDTNLQNVTLRGANLHGAWLLRANLQGVDFSGANLAGTLYEPNPESLPLLPTLTSPENHLEQLVFHDTPAALVALREAFKKAGMRTQERQITYAIERTNRLLAWNPSWGSPYGKDGRPWLENLAGKSTSLFSYVFFEFPSHYGMAPSRALWGLLGFIPVFALVYWLILQHAKGHSGLWMIVPADRLAPGRGKERIVRIKPHLAKTWRERLRSKSRLFCTSLYFSLLSAFHLGWREFNVGTWLARMQPREYTLRPTGWVRTLSGIQSLLSVYLLALWVLTYFGRPFE